MPKKLFVILLTSFFLIPSVTFAGYRCTSTSLANEGDTREEVRSDCGDPVRVYHDVVKYRGHWDNRERWIYERNGKAKGLDFYDGILRKVSRMK